MANIEDADSTGSSENEEMETEVPKRKMVATFKVRGHFCFRIDEMTEWTVRLLLTALSAGEEILFNPLLLRLHSFLLHS